MTARRDGEVAAPFPADGEREERERAADVQRRIAALASKWTAWKREEVEG